MEQQECMQSCINEGCDLTASECRELNKDKCGQRCGVEVSGPPKTSDKGEACMQECVMQGCGDYDFGCQGRNTERCEAKCNMRGDAPDKSKMSAEELCITKCVESESPGTICGSSKEGETGNALCQRCALKCVYLYEGPCLNDEQLTKKEKECETCEHCYGEPVEGPSGEGWDCIVDVVCKDASEEFGDDPGTGPGIGEEGYVNPEEESKENIVTKAVGGVVGFFKRFFGIKK